MKIRNIKMFVGDHTDVKLFRINWDSDELGWGQINIYLNNDGTVEIDSEKTGKEFVKMLLEKIVDNAKLLD